MQKSICLSHMLSHFFAVHLNGIEKCVFILKWHSLASEIKGMSFQWSHIAIFPFCIGTYICEIRIYTNPGNNNTCYKLHL